MVALFEVGEAQSNPYMEALHLLHVAVAKSLGASSSETWFTCTDALLNHLYFSCINTCHTKDVTKTSSQKKNRTQILHTFAWV